MALLLLMIVMFMSSLLTATMLVMLMMLVVPRASAGVIFVRRVDLIWITIHHGMLTILAVACILR